MFLFQGCPLRGVSLYTRISVTVPFLQCSDSTSKKLKLFLGTIAAGLGHFQDGRNSGRLYKQPGSVDSSQNTTTPSSEGTSRQVSGNSESKALKFDFRNYIPPSNAKDSIPECDTGNCAQVTSCSLKSDSENRGTEPNPNSTTRIPRNIPTSEPGSEYRCVTLGNHAPDSDSEDDIEVPRKRDPYDFEESTEGVAFPAHKDPLPLVFSPQDPTLATEEEGGPTILECMGESTPTTAPRKRRAGTGVRRPLRVDLASLCSESKLEATTVKASQHRSSSLAGEDGRSKSIRSGVKRALKQRPSLPDTNRGKGGINSSCWFSYM